MYYLPERRKEKKAGGSLDMDKQQVLDQIFSNDPFGLLEVKPPPAPARTADERLMASFEEVNHFIETNNREPEPNTKNVAEFQLYSRLKSLREDDAKKSALAEADKFNLLKIEKKEINSLEDIFADDSLGLLDDGPEDIFNLKHVKKIDERAAADFVARRKPCKDFKKYEPLFQELKNDLASGRRKFIPFKEDSLEAGQFYVNNGITFYLESINTETSEMEFKTGKRTRIDGRIRAIFENGTESNMLYRSLVKTLYINGKVISANIDKADEELIKNFNNITDEDKEAGFIYVLTSKSTNEKIRSIPHLYKIGYSTTEVNERIKNAVKDPTYLMAAVSVEAIYQCFNMNPQKFENLLHGFFGHACLNIDIFDSKKVRHSPREWFIAPIEIVNQAIALLVNGKIVQYKYDAENQAIVKR
jgi:hypothetical protein